MFFFIYVEIDLTNQENHPQNNQLPVFSTNYGNIPQSGSTTEYANVDNSLSEQSFTLNESQGTSLCSPGM